MTFLTERKLIEKPGYNVHCRFVPGIKSFYSNEGDEHGAWIDASIARLVQLLHLMGFKPWVSCSGLNADHAATKGGEWRENDWGAAYFCVSNPSPWLERAAQDVGMKDVGEWSGSLRCAIYTRRSGRDYSEEHTADVWDKLTDALEQEWERRLLVDVFNDAESDLEYFQRRKRELAIT